jgi:uncharacterized protein YneR
MSEINTLIFYNGGHNGDVHYSREFVKDLQKKINIHSEYYLPLGSSLKIVKDIKNIIFKNNNLFNFNSNEFFVDNENKILFVNTWVGSSNGKHLEMMMGCSLNTNYKKFQNIYRCLNISIEDINFYVPEIDWSFFDVTHVDEFLKNNIFDKYVLISNGPVLSGQSADINLDNIILSLAPKNKNIAFILTDNRSKIQLPNVFYTSDFIKTNGGDLNEIAYLGSKSNIIIGKGSGPFCFCHNKETLYNPNKTFISFTNYMVDGKWALPEHLPKEQAKQIWSNNFDYGHICNIIQNEIMEIL